MPKFCSPPRPRLALRVGITGHRPGPRLPGGEVARVTAEIASILARLTDAAQRTKERHARVFDAAPPDLCLVSALAEGADRIAAKAALEAGWTLEAVLPFTAEAYAQDFESTVSKNAFHDLLKRASSVFCLAMAPEPARRPRAYEAAGHLTLDNCDLLLAVWDGKPGRGQGGTTEIIAEATVRGIALLHVHATGGAPASLIFGDQSIAELGTDLTALVERLVAPPDGSAGLDRYVGEGGADGAARDGYFLGWRFLGWWRFTTWFTAFARVFGSGPAHEHPVLPPVGLERNDADPGTVLLRGRYGVADTISTHLGYVYRSAFILVFLASALAVLSGLAAVFWWEYAGVKAWFVTVEICFIAIVLRLTGVGRSRAWHRRWLETRRLAELLRVAAALASAGGGPPIAPDKEEDADGAWTEWYARSSLREVHLPNAVADRTYLRRMTDGFVADLLDGQIDYHQSNSKRLHMLHHGLDRVGMALFRMTLAIGIGFVACVIVFHVADIHHGHPAYDFFAEWIKPGVTLCSAGLPALGAALYGIRAQGDYEASASRSAASAKALTAVRARLLAARVAADFVVLRGLFAEAAEIMQSDLSDWRQIYRHRPIAVPA